MKRTTRYTNWLALGLLGVLLISCSNANAGVDEGSADMFVQAQQPVSATDEQEDSAEEAVNAAFEKVLGYYFGEHPPTIRIGFESLSPGMLAQAKEDEAGGEYIALDTTSAAMEDLEFVIAHEVAHLLRDEYAGGTGGDCKDKERGADQYAANVLKQKAGRTALPPDSVIPDKCKGAYLNSERRLAIQEAATQPCGPFKQMLLNGNHPVYVPLNIDPHRTYQFYWAGKNGGETLFGAPPTLGDFPNHRSFDAFTTQKAGDRWVKRGYLGVTTRGGGRSSFAYYRDVTDCILKD